MGRAAHVLMLGGPGAIEVIDADSFRPKEARAARDAARIAGKTPILAHHMECLEAMVAAGKRQIAALEDANNRLAFKVGKPETCIVWREGSVWCRILLDWRIPECPVFHDYKTTGGSASPETWAKTAYGFGADVQAGFYRRGIRAVLGIDNPEFRFVVQETTPPYALCVIALTPAALDMAERKAAAAIRLWAACMAAGKWPGYPTQTCFVDPPGYEETRWLEREERGRVRLPTADAIGAAIVAQAPLE